MMFDPVLAGEMRHIGRVLPTPFVAPAFHARVDEMPHAAFDAFVHEGFALDFFRLDAGALTEEGLHGEDAPDGWAFRGGEGVVE